VVRQARLHDRAVATTAVTTPYAIPHGQTRGIAHHHRTSGAEEQGQHSLSPPHSCVSSPAPPNTHHAARCCPAHCDTSAGYGGLQMGQSLASPHHCGGRPRRPDCAHRRNKAAIRGSAACFGRDNPAQGPRSNVRERASRFCSLLEALTAALPCTRASGSFGDLLEQEEREYIYSKCCLKSFLAVTPLHQFPVELSEN